MPQHKILLNSVKDVIFLAKKLKEKLQCVSPIEVSEALLPHIDFCSNRQATVQGCKGVIEYNCDRVRLNCGDNVVKFSGTELTIMAQSIEEITVEGNIVSMEFC